MTLDANAVNPSVPAPSRGDATPATAIRPNDLGARFRLAGRKLDTAPRPAFVEAYRLLAVQVQRLAAQRKLASLLVMSAHPGEGRTTTVANLGLALTELGSRVALIDADARQPDLAALFPDAASPVTTGGPARNAVAAAVSTPRGALEVWHSGLLGKAPLDLPAIEVLLETAGTGVDFAILDSPPCQRFTDAFALASRVDGVLFVVRRRRQNVGMQRSIQEQLGRLGAQVLGVVYNEA